MAEITTKFREKDLMVPSYVVDEEMKKIQYHDMLRADIKEFVSFTSCQTLEYMIDRAQEMEIHLDHLGKRKAKQV